MDIIKRFKDICLQPKSTWPVIEGEPQTVQSLFVPYMLILAGFSAFCSFIGLSIIGYGGFGFGFKLPIGTGLTMMVTQFVMLLIMTFVIGLIINALAPTFGGQKNTVSAMKLAVYSMTPSALGAVFNLVPMLGVLGVLCGLYGLYLLYIGLPVLMKNPEEKSLLYTLAILGVGFVCSLVIAAVNSMFMPKPDLGALLGANDGASISTPMGDVNINTNGTLNAQTHDPMLDIKTADGKQVKIQANEKDGQMTIQTGDGSVTIDMKKMEEMAKQIEALQEKK